MARMKTLRTCFGGSNKRMAPLDVEQAVLLTFDNFKKSHNMNVQILTVFENVLQAFIEVLLQFAKVIKTWDAGCNIFKTIGITATSLGRNYLLLLIWGSWHKSLLSDVALRSELNALDLKTSLFSSARPVAPLFRQLPSNTSTGFDSRFSVLEQLPRPFGFSWFSSDPPLLCEPELTTAHSFSVTVIGMLSLPALQCRSPHSWGFHLWLWKSPMPSRVTDQESPCNRLPLARSKFSTPSTATLIFFHI